METWHCRAAIYALGFVLCAQGAALALDNPVKFESKDGRLDLIITATASEVHFGGVTTTGWVYDVCRRASHTHTSCIPGTAAKPYGGVWLHLQPNDTLNIRLVNKLPTVPGGDHCNADLVNNPTNLHTHGLIVEPYGGRPYGDYIFLEVRNTNNNGQCSTPQNAAAAASAHAMHGASENDAAEYAIHLVNHPPGVFWFHPHVHGVALNQVTSGLAGIITVGEAVDACGDQQCRDTLAATPDQLMVLKDSQVLADGTLLNQQASPFCEPTAVAGESPRWGVCAGDVDPNHKGGHWFHTINGELYPSVTVGEHGALWRILNAAGSRSYDLSLLADDGETLPLQVIAMDGITIDSSLSSKETLPTLQAQVGRRMNVFRCSDVPVDRYGEAVCTRHIRMMPASRVSVRVLNGEPRMRHAVWRTNVYNTNGDQWPAIDLASIELAAPMAGPAPPLKIPGGAKKVVSPVGVLGAPARLAMPGADRPLSLDEARAQPSVKEMMSASPGLQPKYPIDPALRLGLRQDPACANLQPGEHRRIYFGTPDNHNNDPNRNFGIATSVIGADGREKNLTDMLPFDVSNDPICLTASGDKDNPTTEFWEIYNLTNEDHNFHVHQTRFAVVPAAVAQAGKIPDGAVLQDNTPLVRASDDMKTCTGNLADFKTCNPDPVWVGIPFTEIGDFVFHCHILEHEDGGMMANIRVVPPPLAAKQ